MFRMRLLTVESERFKAVLISTMEYPYTLKLNTASSSAVKLHSRRNLAHSGLVRPVFKFIPLPNPHLCQEIKENPPF